MMERDALQDLVQVQRDDFSVAEHYQRLQQAAGNTGAVVFFVGTVRAESETDPVLALELEHYPAMTEKSLRSLVVEARSRWSLDAITIVHRVGKLAVGQQIVLVAVSSRHRDEAFLSARFLMDTLKTQAPFWKKEHRRSGAYWVAAREQDDAAVAEWRQGNR
ncbi:molybdenum cofactor biosynthesis protein MoaE [uncultured Gilvimarinus sp.]|uniref:molybdenum cofactor biosynthesis protein MoaE n=1 Tax=uncultured Gilvimarinus sp. TaxID=1689143 RepID=UPI0030D7F3A8